MATTTVPLTNPLFLRDVSLIIGPSAADFEFKAALESVEFVPSSSVSTWVGIGGVTLSDTPPATWVCNVKFAQDYATPTSLSNYLLANEGLTTDATFVPKAGGAEVSAVITLVPGNIGGGAGLATSSVTFGVQGTPVVA